MARRYLTYCWLSVNSTVAEREQIMPMMARGETVRGYMLHFSLWLWRTGDRKGKRTTTGLGVRVAHSWIASRSRDIVNRQFRRPFHVLEDGLAWMISVGMLWRVITRRTVDH